MRSINLFEKTYFLSLRQTLFRVPPHDYAEEFLSLKFAKNNLRTLVLSFFLFFEQSFYGFFFSTPHSSLQSVFFFTASVMPLFFFMSLYFQKNRPVKITVFHQLCYIIPAWFAMAIALKRFIITEFTQFHLPTIYIAVIYGLAVVYYFTYAQSIFLYLFFTIAAIVLFPVFHPHITGYVYIADISSNTIIAWIISYFNYNNFVKDFQNQKTIQEKNRILTENNDQIAFINNKLLELSERDPLTGLFNRRKLDEIIKREQEQANRYGTDFSVIILDIDYFKKINDLHGHDIGDETLKQFAEILSKNTRNTDDCGRWGGEEFMLVCRENDLSLATKFSERLRININSVSFNKVGSVTASFGVASYRESGSNTSILIKTADERLYTAKKNGRDRVENGSIK